jgi:Lon protease-like protein
MPLALRVFEERYLKMMGAVLDHETPHFGVVLIERGSEVGGGEQRFVYGTLAKILQVEAPDGPLAVVARGAERFRVIEWLPDDPYPQARVEILESFDAGAVSDDDIAATERLVRDTLSSAAELGADVTWPSDLELSEDPVEKAWQLAGISPLGPLDHYDFLASDNLEALLTTVRDTVREALETFRMTRNQGESS